MSTIYDAVDVAAIPANAQIILAYIDGYYQTYSAVRARFPNALILTVTTTGLNAADICDVESGDATPAIAAKGVAAGLYKTVYSSDGHTQHWWQPSKSHGNGTQLTPPVPPIWSLAPLPHSGHGPDTAHRVTMIFQLPMGCIRTPQHQVRPQAPHPYPPLPQEQMTICSHSYSRFPPYRDQFS